MAFTKRWPGHLKTACPHVDLRSGQRALQTLTLPHAGLPCSRLPPGLLSPGRMQLRGVEVFSKRCSNPVWSDAPDVGAWHRGDDETVPLAG